MPTGYEDLPDVADPWYVKTAEFAKNNPDQPIKGYEDLPDVDLGGKLFSPPDYFGDTTPIASDPSYELKERPSSTFLPEFNPANQARINLEKEQEAKDLSAEAERINAHFMPLKEMAGGNLDKYNLAEESRKQALRDIGVTPVGPMPDPHLQKIQSRDLETLGLPSTASKITAGVGNAAIGAAEFFISPEGALMLGGMKYLPDNFRRQVSGIFAADMASKSPALVKEMVKAWKDGDTERAWMLGTSAGLNVLFAKAALKHAMDTPLSEASEAIAREIANGKMQFKIDPDKYAATVLRPGRPGTFQFTESPVRPVNQPANEFGDIPPTINPDLATGDRRQYGREYRTGTESRNVQGGADEVDAAYVPPHHVITAPRRTPTWTRKAENLGVPEAPPIPKPPADGRSRKILKIVLDGMGFNHDQLDPVSDFIGGKHTDETDEEFRDRATSSIRDSGLLIPNESNSYSSEKNLRENQATSGMTDDEIKETAVKRNQRDIDIYNHNIAKLKELGHKPNYIPLYDSETRQSVPGGERTQEEGQAQKPGQVPVQETSGEPAATDETGLTGLRQTREQTGQYRGYRGNPSSPPKESLTDEQMRSRLAGIPAPAPEPEPIPGSGIEQRQSRPVYGNLRSWLAKPTSSRYGEGVASLRSRMAQQRALNPKSVPVKKKADTGVGSQLDSVTGAYEAAQEIVSTSGPNAAKGRPVAPEPATDRDAFGEVVSGSKPAAILDKGFNVAEKEALARQAASLGFEAVRIKDPITDRIYFIVGKKWATDTLLNRYNKPITELDHAASGLALGYHPNDIAAYLRSQHGKEQTGGILSRTIETIDGKPYEPERFTSSAVPVQKYSNLAKDLRKKEALPPDPNVYQPADQPIERQPKSEKVNEIEQRIQAYLKDLEKKKAPDNTEGGTISKTVNETPDEYVRKAAYKGQKLWTELGDRFGYAQSKSWLNELEEDLYDNNEGFRKWRDTARKKSYGYDPGYEAETAIRAILYEAKKPSSGGLTETVDELQRILNSDPIGQEILTISRRLDSDYPSTKLFIREKLEQTGEFESDEINAILEDPTIYEEYRRQLWLEHPDLASFMDQIFKFNNDSHDSPTEIVASAMSGGVVRSTGLSELAKLIRDPANKIDPQHRHVIEALLKEPALRDLFWSRLEFALGKSSIPGTSGSFDVTTDAVGRVAEVAISMIREATPDSFPHEVFHVLFALAPKDIQARVRELRLQAIDGAIQNGDYNDAYFLRKLKDQEISSREFLESGMPEKYYDLINPSEFMASFAGRRFADSVLNPKDATLLNRINGWVKGVVNWLRNAVGMPKSLEQIYGDMLAGKYKNGPQGGIEFEGGSIASATKKLQEETEPDRKAAAVQRLEQERSGSIISQIQIANDLADQFANELAVRNTRGNIVIKGPELARQKVFDEMAKIPAMQSLIGPVLELRDSMKLVGGAVTRYRDLKADPNTDPVELSSVAAIGRKQLDGLWDNRWQFEKDRLAQEKTFMGQLKQGLDDALELAQAGAVSAAKDQLKESVKGPNTPLKEALGGANKTLDWFLKNKEISPVLSRMSADDLFNYIDHAVAEKVTPEKSWEMVAGTTKPVVKLLAEKIMADPALKATVEYAIKYRDNPQSEGNLGDLKKEVLELAAQGKYPEAVKVMSEGFGANVVEKAHTKEALGIYAKDLKGTLVKLEANQRAKEYLDEVFGNPEFKAISEEIVGDSGILMVQHLGDKNAYVLEPIYKTDQRQELDMDQNSFGYEENLKKLNDYFKRATEYVTRKDDPEYDPRKAAGLRTFLAEQGPWVSTDLNPAAGNYFKKSLTRTAFNKVGQIFKRIDLVPLFALDRAYGLAGELAIRSLQRVNLIMELIPAIFNDHKKPLFDSLKAALKSHGINERRIEFYRENIWNFLLGSLQSWENLSRLKVGSDIGNGFKVTKEDMALLKANRDMEKDGMLTSRGDGHRKFTALETNPHKVVYKNKAGDTLLRNQEETGPATMSRRLIGRMTQWANLYQGKPAKDKIEFLNSHRAALFGYAFDADVDSYVGTYLYRPELREIMSEARAGNTIVGFDDLVDRLFEKVGQREDNPEDFSRDTVRNTVLSEIDSAFKRFEDWSKDEVKKEKGKVIAFGGENSFNTERGEQIVPSGWYNYGSLTMPDIISYLHNMATQPMLDHITAVERLEGALRTLNYKYEENLVPHPDDYFYNKGETARAHQEVVDYLNYLNKALQETERIHVPGSTTELFSGSANPLFSLAIAAKLGGPQSNVFNLGGGLANGVIVESRIRNNGATALAKGLLWRPVRMTFDEVTHLLFHQHTPWGKQAYEFLNNAQHKPVVGKITKILFDYISHSQDIYDSANALGMNPNLNMLKNSVAELNFWRTGGRPTEESESGPIMTALKNVGGPLGYAARVYARLGTPIGLTDARVNKNGIHLAQDLEQDLMNRANKYMPGRVEQARRDGYDPYDASDLRNRFSDKELVGTRLRPIGLGDADAATSFRETARRLADINLDAAMADWYRRKQTDPEASLLTEGQRNQLSVALSMQSNQATFATRPIAPRTSKTVAALSIFYGYPAYQLHLLTSLLDEQAKNGNKGQRIIKNMPLIISAAMAAIVAANTSMVTSDYLKQKLEDKPLPYHNIANAINDKDAARGAALAVASTIPLFGTIALWYLQDSPWRRGFDPNNMFLIANYLSDLSQTSQELFATRESAYKGDPSWLMPVLKLLGRDMPGFRYLNPMLEVMKGRNQRAKATAIIIATASATGIPMKKHGGGSFEIGPEKVITDKFENAMGNGNRNEALAARNELVQFYKDHGEKDPEKRATSRLQRIEFIQKAFGEKPTDPTWQKVLANMKPEERKLVEEQLRFQDEIMSAIGAKEFTPKAEGGGGPAAPSFPKESGGGGAMRFSTGVSGGSSLGYARGPSIYSGSGVPRNSGLRVLSGAVGGSKRSRVKLGKLRSRSGRVKRVRFSLGRRGRKVGLNRLRRSVSLKRGLVS